MLSCMIDTMEGSDVKTDDIEGDFIQTDEYRLDIHIKIKGEMVTLLYDIDRAHYKDFI